MKGRNNKLKSAFSAETMAYVFFTEHLPTRTQPMVLAFASPSKTNPFDLGQKSCFGLDILAGIDDANFAFENATFD